MDAPQEDAQGRSKATRIAGQHSSEKQGGLRVQAPSQTLDRGGQMVGEVAGQSPVPFPEKCGQED